MERRYAPTPFKINSEEASGWIPMSKRRKMERKLGMRPGQKIWANASNKDGVQSRALVRDYQNGFTKLYAESGFTEAGKKYLTRGSYVKFDGIVRMYPYRDSDRYEWKDGVKFLIRSKNNQMPGID